MYILKEKRRHLMPQRLRHRGDLRRKMDVRWCNVAGVMCAVPHLTSSIPDRNSLAAAAPRVQKTDVCNGP